MATPAPQTQNAIVLEGLRDGHSCSITIEFAAIQELRAIVKRPDEVASGAIRGALSEDRISVEHCAPATAADRVVGLFRTQPAGWPSVTEPDYERLRAAMPRSTAALLMVVRTLAQRPWSAALFLVDPKRPAVNDAALIEFPFDEYLLTNGWLTDLAPPPAPLPPRLAAPRGSRLARWIAAVAVVTALGAAGAVYQSKWRPWTRTADAADVADLPPAVAPLIGLQATRSLDEMEVTWNRASDLVRAATAATLIIHNGPVTRMVPVSLPQLREGRVMYHPVSGVDADFRLELTMPDGRVEAESIQMLGFDTSPSLTLPVAAQRPPKAQESADRKEAPPVTLPAPSGGAQTEPQPVKRVNPLLTPDVLEEMRNAKGVVTISVLVNIDAAGKVDTARIVAATGEPPRSGSHIRLAALIAAKQWRFRPATVGGRAAPSTLTLAFSF